MKILLWLFRAVVKHDDVEKGIILPTNKPKKAPKNLGPRGKKIEYKSNKKIIQMQKNLKVIN